MRRQPRAVNAVTQLTGRRGHHRSDNGHTHGGLVINTTDRCPVYTASRATIPCRLQSLQFNVCSTDNRCDRLLCQSRVTTKYLRRAVYRWQDHSAHVKVCPFRYCSKHVSLYLCLQRSYASTMSCRPTVGVLMSFCTDRRTNKLWVSLLKTTNRRHCRGVAKSVTQSHVPTSVLWDPVFTTLTFWGPSRL